MEQSSVTNLKRKPSMLSLQPPKLRSPQQLTKNSKASLPRTSYSLPIKRDKRSVSFSEQDDSPREKKAKKRKITKKKGILSTPPNLASFSLFESRYSPASQYRVIFPIKLIKA